MEGAEGIPAYSWWQANGSSTPNLRQLVCIVLAQPGSASICERINSEFGFIKDKKRNRLNHKRANKLVSLFHNLRMKKNMSQPRYVETAVAWNDEDMESGITTYGVDYYSAPLFTKIANPVRPELPSDLDPSSSDDEQDQQVDPRSLTARVKTRRLRSRLEQ